MRTIIRVWIGSLDRLLLIVPLKTGVEYSTQSDGNRCRNRVMEGFTIELDDHGTLSEELCKATINKSGITTEQADLIDELLASSQQVLPCNAEHLRVDRSRLDESGEAWLHVLVLGDPPGPVPLWTGLGETSAVLTWLNSD